MHSSAPPKRLLFGPGPTMVEPRVYAAMSQPIVSHLDGYFLQVVDEIREGLRGVFGTKNPFTLVISGTGSAGMETAVANFVEPGSKFGVFAAGFFADRLTEMGRRQRADVVRCEKPWGQVFTEAEARQFIGRERPSVVAFVQAETSTGAFQSGRAIADAAREADALVIADCVTSLGAMPVEADKNGIDIAYSCTQKGLSCPPGLAPLTVSQRALDRLRKRVTPVQSWYLDLKLLEEYFGALHRYHHTAPVSLFYALREGLAIIAEEGLENRCERHRRAHLEFLKAVDAMGMKMLVAERERIWHLNTPLVPKGVSDAEVRKSLLDKHGIEILGGFGPLAGKIFRIGIMGPLATSANVELLAGALQAELIGHAASQKS